MKSRRNMRLLNTVNPVDRKDISSLWSIFVRREEIDTITENI